VCRNWLSLVLLFSFLILASVFRFLVEFNLYSWWNSDLFAKGNRDMQLPCDTEYPAFISERTIKENMGNIDCGGCFKSFVIQQIPSSNLFMVVVDNKCDCSLFEPITMDPIEIMYILYWSCERLKMQKDRRRPDTCHPFHPEENSMECGGAVTLISSLVSILLSLLIAVFIR
uniref:Voltage-dependent calcium channel alpha-2/delta subunit conserved region domain-containing protein n=1 Tax=Oryzias sinensis TaxID=183150 RepID=A0A8C7Z614_9TELE